ncbi:MAG: hypothetical protein ACRETA_14285 [Gammaproteobacteria bacterium]
MVLRRGASGCVVPNHREVKMGTLSACSNKQAFPRKSSSTPCAGKVPPSIRNCEPCDSGSEIGIPILLKCECLQGDSISIIHATE